MKWHADSLKYIKLYTEKELKEFWITNKSCCSLLSGLSVWMCVYIHYILTCLIEHVNACECMVAKLCVCMWRKRLMSDVLPQIRSTLVYETGSFIGIWSSQIRLGWLAGEPQGSSCLLLQCRDYGHFNFYMSFGIEFWSLCCVASTLLAEIT